VVVTPLNVSLLLLIRHGNSLYTAHCLFLFSVLFIVYFAVFMYFFNATIVW